MLGRTRGSGRAAKAPAVPKGKRIYAIGDIHGELQLLEDLIAQISADLLADPVLHAQFIFLGDYIDRGPQSSDVLAFMAEMNGESEVVCLRGNHEQILLNFLDDPSVLDGWRLHGGLETLQSYGVQTDQAKAGHGYVEARDALLRRLPQSHIDFLESTRYSFTVGDYFFCHAGIDPQAPLSKQKPQDLMWIRQQFFAQQSRFEKMIVHGHTRVRAPDIRPNRINIDTGAYDTGILTCLVLEGQKMRFLSTAPAALRAASLNMSA
ncbi:MAG: metallophosphoesterase family protein [Beijerinckiaceae bacterium]